MVGRIGIKRHCITVATGALQQVHTMQAVHHPCLDSWKHRESQSDTDNGPRVIHGNLINALGQSQEPSTMPRCTDSKPFRMNTALCNAQRLTLNEDSIDAIWCISTLSGSPKSDQIASPQASHFHKRRCYLMSYDSSQ